MLVVFVSQGRIHLTIDDDINFQESSTSAARAACTSGARRDQDVCQQQGHQDREPVHCRVSAPHRLLQVGHIRCKDAREEGQSGDAVRNS